MGVLISYSSRRNQYEVIFEDGTTIWCSLADIRKSGGFIDPKPGSQVLHYTTHFIQSILKIPNRMPTIKFIDPRKRSGATRDPPAARVGRSPAMKQSRKRARVCKSSRYAERARSRNSDADDNAATHRGNLLALPYPGIRQYK